jgi:hypothetical protein
MTWYWWHSKEGLQRSTDAAYECSRKWRFLFKVGKDKTEIMIFHGKGASKKRIEGEVDAWEMGVGRKENRDSKEVCVFGSRDR